MKNKVVERNLHKNEGSNSIRGKKMIQRQRISKDNQPNQGGKSALGL